MSKYGNAFDQTDLSIGLDYLPAEVARVVNKNIANGGGGGGQQVTSTSVDPDIKRHVTPVLGDVRRLYEQGKLGQVADTSGMQSALDQSANMAQQTMQEGLGAENLVNAMKSTEGQIIQGQQGALGSARADRAREAAVLDRGMELSAADQQAKQRAAGILTNAEQAKRGLEQEGLDSEAKAAERFFGYLGSAPQGQTQTSRGGGGK